MPSLKDWLHSRIGVDDQNALRDEIEIATTTGKLSGKQYGELMDAWRNAQVPDAEIVDSSAEWGRKACEAIRDAESVDNVKARLTDAYTWLTVGYLTPEDYNKVEEYANQRLEKLNGNETAND